MVDDIQRILMPPHTLRRLRPSAMAEAHGYLRFAVAGAGASGRERLVPVGGGLAFFLRAGEEAVTVSLSADEAAIESVGWGEAALAMLRRRFTRLRQGVLDFDGVEIFPFGPKARTKRYRKQVRRIRRMRLLPDSQTMLDHPELIAGLPVGSGSKPAARMASGSSVAVALHLYYVELWPEIEALLKRWSFPFTLFLTLNCEDPELATRVRAAFPGSVINVVDNRGRDVRPFLLLLEEGAFDSFDLVCKIHGKRSIGNERIAIFGDLMRRAIFLDLIATDEQVLKIVQMFHASSQIGLIGPRRLRLAPNGKSLRSLLGRNRLATESIAARMGGAIHKDAFDFFEGTMFWVRPQALAPLRRLRLAEESFAPEAGLGDGALEHAIERLFSHTARVAGFRVEAVAVDDEPTAIAPRPSKATFKSENARETFAHRN